MFSNTGKYGFFKTLQEKASSLTKVAKEYYDEGIAYANNEAEQQKQMEDHKNQKIKVAPAETINVRKVNSQSETIPSLNLYSLDHENDRYEESEHTETLDADADSAREYQELLENYQKRDNEYQHIIRDNEDRIFKLTEANQKLQSQLQNKDELISKYKTELKSVSHHNSDHQMICVELSSESVSPIVPNNDKESRMKKLCDILDRLSKMNEQFKRRSSLIFNEEFHIKTTIAKAKLEIDRTNKLTNELALRVDEIERLKTEIKKTRLSENTLDSEEMQKYIQEIDLLKSNNEKIEKQKNDFKQKYLNTSAEGKEIRQQFHDSQNTIVKLNDEINDLKTDNQNCLNKIDKLNEEILNLKNSNSKLAEETKNIDVTIAKFGEFWEFILMDNERVLSNLDKSIPNFKSLFSKLNVDEKAKFKPILQIVAHSLQFLKKIISLDESYNFLQKDYKNFASTTNDSIDQSLTMEKSKLETLEKQLSIMQEECTKLRDKETASKCQIRQLEQELKNADSIPELKKEKLGLQVELDELKERFNSLVGENEKYKLQINTHISQMKEDQKIIENMNKKIMNSLELETQIDRLQSLNEKFKHELTQKDNEINMQRVEISNMQDAFADIQDNSLSKPIIETKKVDKNIEKSYADKFKQLQSEYDFVKPQLETLEKYKLQVSELCNQNAEMLKKMKLP